MEQPGWTHPPGELPGEEIVDAIDKTVPYEDNAGAQEVPMDIERWHSMTPHGRSAYVRVLIDGLKWSPFYDSCSNLSTDSLTAALEQAIASPEDSSGPLMMPFAVALQHLCGE